MSDQENATPDQNIEQLKEAILEILVDSDVKDPSYVTGWRLDEDLVADKVLALISKQVSEAEKDKLEWAWAIIANAGKIWDEDTKEAKEWREVAWKLEKDFYDHIKQTPPTPNGDEQGASASPSTPTALSKQADNCACGRTFEHKHLIDQHIANTKQPGQHFVIWKGDPTAPTSVNREDT